MAIYFISDLHFGHDREFIWGPRGFDNVYDHDKAIIENWNKTVNMEDDVYVLGDLMLGNNEEGIKKIKQLKGKIHIILGNHDTDARVKLYKECYNVVEVELAKRIKIDGWHIYLSHYPTITSNLEKKFNKACVLNFYAHTHQKTNFYQDMPFCYHVGADSHNCTPISFEEIIEDIKKEVKNCKYYL